MLQYEAFKWNATLLLYRGKRFIEPDKQSAIAEMTSPTGRCHTFDASADGYVRSEGCGALVLQRVADAQADNRGMHAIVRGVSVAHDGTSASLTAPNGRAQEQLIRSALRDAEITADDLDYLESHGTGTALGDPVEMSAVAAVMRSGERIAEQPLMVGGVKANVGHLEPAAGMAGLIHAVLVLQHEEVPPNAELRTLNPRIEEVAKDAAIRFPRECESLRSKSGKGADEALMAGVSSFGYAGTIAHAVLSQVATSDFRREDLQSSRLVSDVYGNRCSFPWKRIDTISMNMPLYNVAWTMSSATMILESASVESVTVVQLPVVVRLMRCFQIYLHILAHCALVSSQTI